LELLDILKQIETEMGRDFGQIRNGPRIIDLDILFYENIEMNHERLIIPHPRIQERFFVLEPLTDIASEFHHPTLFRTVGQLLKILQHSDIEQDKIHRVFPIRGTIWNFDSQTYIMGILNTTPDSFSDGGKNYDLDSAVQNALQMVEEKVDIIDIGGQSTRPNAPEITEQEEIGRVVPVIKAIREKNKTVPISVDTFRAKVALAAIEAGADLINDVSGGTRDPHMLQAMKQTNVPVCLMHMRGDSKTMMQLTNYKGDLMTAIRSELTSIVSNAIKNGIFRWNILIDPGIGFAKDYEQNFTILKRLQELSREELVHLPLLVGVSRKGFIGTVTDKKVPNERVYGTAAANTIAIMNGANIIRVHDIKEMRDVLLVADKSK
jgi:dihydroneopterin aldolase/2-amino-4-hydroxy-6-hydroxymethyldihydropteridine diphosphokinase/dihydropteroate synthase/2-amino-4-hydroxy-6-hydroxymethyldihydropteridine diphosphokinase/dihydropteroate synthase